MKNKKRSCRILALVLVLILTLGIVAAGENTGGTSTEGTVYSNWLRLEDMLTSEETAEAAESTETAEAGSATRTKQSPERPLPSVVVAVIVQVPIIFGFSSPE